MPMKMAKWQFCTSKMAIYGKRLVQLGSSWGNKGGKLGAMEALEGRRDCDKSAHCWRCHINHITYITHTLQGVASFLFMILLPDYFALHI